MKFKNLIWIVAILILSNLVLSAPTGGVITYNGNKTVHTYNLTNGTFTVDATIIADILVIAGGGGGGSSGGGGGAGGFRFNSSVTLTAGNYAVIVGTGGNGGISVDGQGGNGSYSSFGTLINMTGGGGGSTPSTATGIGWRGGSGGGGAGAVSPPTGGLGIVGQGLNGGSGTLASPYCGGGGGGAGSNGGNASGANCAIGGLGISSNITGVLYNFSCGGSASGRGDAGAGCYPASCGGGDGNCAGNGYNAYNGSGSGGGGGRLPGGSANGGSGGSGIVIITYLTNETPSSAIPTVAIVTPSASGFNNNSQINISLSCTAVNSRFDLWHGTTNPPTTKVLNNVSTSYWITNITTQTTYYFFARCYNVSNSLYSSNTSVYNWTYDATFPAITTNNPNNFFNSNNNSNSNQYNNSAIINLTFTDNNELYAFEINITKNGVTYFNITNTTITGLSANYYTVLNTTTWGAGVYNIAVFVSDSHTDEEIEPYEVTEEKNKIKFKTQTNNEISIYTSEESTIKGLKKKDRYSFDVKFKTKYEKDRLFHITSSSCHLTYLENSKYKAHFISMCNDDGNWIDFEGVTGTPFVNKIDDFHYTIYFTNLESDVIFNSIGGLNVYSANFTWYKGNYSFTNVSGFANEPQSFYLNVTYNSSYITDINATFSYNLSNQIVYESSNSEVFIFNSSITLPDLEANYNFIWNVTILQINGSSYSFLINSTSYVYNWYLDNCTTTTTPSIIIKYYNESTPTVIQNNSLEVYLTYWLSNLSNAKFLNTTFPANINHTICIYPNESINIDAYFKYSNNVYTHRYYLLNHTISNFSQTINMYNIDSTAGVSVLKLTARRISDYNYYKNVVTTLERFYVGEGVWRAVQMDESGDFGIINFDIFERTVDYRLIFVDRATTNEIKQSESMKFICTSGLCDLTYLLNPDTATTTIDEVTYNVSVNTTSKLINVTWDDDTGISQTINLKVWKPTITGVQTICDTTQIGNAGSFGCNASGYSGVIYVNLKQSGLSIYGGTYELDGDKLADYLPVGEGGFYALFMMVLTVTFGLFSPVGAIISGCFGLVLIYWLGIFNPLTITGLIIALIVGALIGFKIKN